MQMKIWLWAFIMGAMIAVGTAWGQVDFYVIGGGGPPVGTKITSLPYIINNSGFYYLAS